ncbi:MAG: hypothetical protein VXX13_14550, partial [Pseudomonadota bacterium]|nr:hypothetical protein [Pseudomonadota bacterium]
AALSDADARRGVTMIHDSYHILHRLIAGLPDRGWRRRRLEKPIRLVWTLAAVGRGYLGRVLSGGAQSTGNRAAATRRLSDSKTL